MLAEPFDNNKVNSYLERCVAECKNHIVFKDCMGINLPILDDAYHAYELLLHMLQHFLREGFGLKLLTDWCFFFNREIIIFFTILITTFYIWYIPFFIFIFFIY